MVTPAVRPIQHIRTVILGVTQMRLADIAGVTQATVSRWESGEQHLGEQEMSRIREFIRKSGKPWDDKWFFEVPAKGRPEKAA